MNTKPFDQTADVTGQQLYRLTRLYQLPNFVKSASSDAIYGEDEMENHQYADPTYRAFPCHTGPATYISTLFFLDKKADMNPEKAAFIEQRLDNFAYLHGILQSVAALKTKIASINKISSLDELPDEDFALILDPQDSPDGTRARLYPLRNALEVKKAAEWLEQYKDDISYDIRQKIAEAILSKAEVFGAGLGDLDEFLHKQAGIGACAYNDAAKLVNNRAALLKKMGKHDISTKLSEIAKTINKNPTAVNNSEQLIKLAGLIDDIDRETGLNRLVNDLTRPEDVFFEITEKLATTLRNEHISTVSGNIYKLADFDGLKLNDVRDTMGSEFADAISTGGLFVSPEKMAEIVPTLPLNDSELFDSFLQSFGISPVAKEAAHVSNRLSDEDLVTLASSHKPAKW